VSPVSCTGYVPDRELAFAFLTGRLEALNVTLTSAEGEKRGLYAPDLGAVHETTRGVHDLTQSVAIFLERLTADISLQSLTYGTLFFPAHAPHNRFTRCAAFGPATFSRRVRTDGAALAAHVHCATSVVRLGFDFRTLFLPLFFRRRGVCTRVWVSSPGRCISSCVFRRRAGLLLESRGGPRVGVLARQLVCSPLSPQALVVYHPLCDICQCAPRSITWAVAAGASGSAW